MSVIVSQQARTLITEALLALHPQPVGPNVMAYVSNFRQELAGCTFASGITLMPEPSQLTPNAMNYVGRIEIAIIPYVDNVALLEHGPINIQEELSFTGQVDPEQVKAKAIAALDAFYEQLATLGLTETPASKLAL